MTLAASPDVRRRAAVLLGATVLFAGCDRAPAASKPAPISDRGSGAAISITVPAPKKLWSGLVSFDAVAVTPRDAAFPTTGYPGSSFHLGIIDDEPSWKAFTTAAKIHPPAIQLTDEVVVVALLDARTNQLGVEAVTVDAAGHATMVVDWIGIEPYYGDSTPAALATVPRHGVTDVTIQTTDGTTLGVVKMP